MEFNMPHAHILGKHHCGKENNQTFKWRESCIDVKFCCDYAECLVAIFTNQIQSDYYGGNISVSM